MGMVAALDLSSRETIAAALRETVLAFGGVDIVINTAAIYPTADPSSHPRRRSGRGRCTSTSRATTCWPRKRRTS
jgi:NAD(P)-dependent dehydrogenase (short-subunit alcohol dehydrogenase family)